MSQEAVFATIMTNHYLEIDNEKIKKFCYDLRETDIGRQMTNVGGWQSNDFDLECDELSEVIDAVGKAFSEIFSLYSFEEGDIKISNSWININPKQSYNLQHNHVGSLFSAVYYVQAEEEMGDIVFINPCPTLSHHLSFFNLKKKTPINSETWKMTPQTGQLIVFPSWMEHYVMPNMNDKDRISIAINAFIMQHKT